MQNASKSIVKLQFLQSQYIKPFTLYIVFHQPYAIFLLLMFSQQGIQIMFLEDYECFILHSVYGDRGQGKWKRRGNRHPYILTSSDIYEESKLSNVSPRGALPLKMQNKLSCL